MKVVTYKTEQECRDAVTGETFFRYCGPIHRHQGQDFVQIYLGQHEWMAVNVADPADVRCDPGYNGVVFGYGQIILEDREFISDHCDWSREISEPESAHAPITHDEILFGDREKVETYLDCSLEKYKEA